MVPAEGSIHASSLPCFLLELPTDFSFVLPSGSSSRSPVLPVPALISSALTQSPVALCLFPAKPSPFGLLSAGGSPGRGNVCTQVLPSLFWLEPGASLPASHIPGIPAPGMAWEAFQAGWSISCSGSPLHISSCCIPEKGTKSFRTCCSPSQWRRRHQLCIPTSGIWVWLLFSA